MAGKSTKKKFPISADAMKAYHYQELHRENPTRKLYVLHTIRKRCKAIVKRLDFLQQIKAINCSIYE
ncbi:hypothetical protein CMV16_00320 [Peribacillus simplex]|nr:hypothetical protein CMV16_00320 [Peribacillus simplex]